MLACWWLSIGLVLIVILVIQTMQDMYKNEFERAWSWLIPTLIPTLSVIVGGIVHTTSNPDSKFRVTREIYRLAKWLSVAYLGLLLLTASLVGFQAQMTAVQWLEASKLWLTPLNAPVGIVLGVFFASSHSQSTGVPTGAPAAPVTPGGAH
jgi:hypothetical protein